MVEYFGDALLAASVSPLTNLISYFSFALCYEFLVQHTVSVVKGAKAAEFP